jgi:hypothetical protein
VNKEKVTHYGRGNQRRPFEYFTVRFDGQLGFIVHGFGIYEMSSVLAGQSRKVFLDSFDTREAALAIYPEAENGNDFLDPQVSVAHLPGENDPVPGGMYPDDIVDSQIAHDEGADIFDTLRDDEK